MGVEVGHSESFIETKLLMFEEKPVGTFIALSHWQKALLSSLARL
jgi:hypothetical protein